MANIHNDPGPEGSPNNSNAPLPDSRGPHRVRFSIGEAPDTTRPLLSAQRHHLTLDTQATRNTQIDGISEREGQDDDQIPIQEEPSLSATSPLSPRRRSRGYSLRTQLFFRNAQNQARTSGSDNPTSQAQSDALPIELVPVRIESGYGVEGSKRIGISDHKYEKAATSSAYLPHYTEWTKRHTKSFGPRARNLYHTLRKTVLRINEIPPSKDGRHIALDIERKGHLIDERTGKHYINNIIRSSRYTVWNFFPKQLIAQFSKLANL